MDFRGRLEACELIHAAEASLALANGWAASLSPRLSVSELKFVYARRLRHVARLPGDHAKALAAATEEMLKQLEAVPSEVAHCLTIKGDAEHHFLVLVLETGELLGCLRVVGKSNVSESRWESLWREGD